MRRLRVSQALLSATERGAAWVQAPGGWGKTTAVAALAEDLKRPVAWLHLDEGDAQPLAFFHFLRLATIRALPKSERALPVFGSELAAEPAQFARRFARAAIESAPEPGATLVLDNLQEVPEASPVHVGIAALAEELAPAWKVFLVTRREPGTAYLKLLGQGRLDPVAPEGFGFTAAELRQALRERGILDERRLAELASRSGGWIAGALLLALHGGDDKLADREKDPGAVFDYFATQALARVSSEDRRLLERTAFMATIPAEAAARISGVEDAPRRLERMARDGLFTTKLEGSPARFRYHDLFRGYLAAEARATLGPPALESLLRASAGESLAAGETLQALELMCECRAWDDFGRAVPDAARPLLGQGHYGRLAELIRQVPESRLDGEPWLRYWLGQCELQMSDDRAQAELERAHDAFERAGDRAGCLLVAIEMPGLLFNTLAGTAVRVKWIERIESSVNAVEDLREPDLLLRALSALVSLYESEVLEARVPELAQRLMEVLPRVEDPNLRLHALGRVAMTAWRTRRHELGPPVIAMAAEQELARRASPLRVLHWYYESITFDSIFGDPARAAADGLRAEAIAASIGQPHLMGEALLLRLEAACDSNDIALAHTLLARLEALVDSRRPSLVTAAILFAGRLALLEDDGAAAIGKVASATRTYEAAGGSAGRNPALAGIDVVGLALLGRFEDALEACRRYAGTLRRFDRPAIDTAAAWIRAAAALHRGDPSAREALAIAVATAMARTDYHPLRCGSRLAAELCARALEWNLEPDFIRAIIRRRRLKAPDDAPSTWPWPLRVRALGGFELVRDGEPIADRGRAQKSLELLQLAIAQGGEQVPVDRLVKTLWPGEGREGAQQAFDTTLHRLRKLLGADEVLRVADRRLSIDADLAWVDALVLQRRLKALENARDGSSDDWRALIALYQGHFLPHRTGEAWADEARERLWGGTRRLLLGAARKSRSDGDAALAERLLYFIMDLDPLAEDAVGELMRLHLERGEAAEALRVFRRCEAALAAELKVAPGGELKALAERARSSRVSQL